MSLGSISQQAQRSVALSGATNAEFVTLTIAGQLFGIPVLQVQDVLGPQRLTRVPTADREIAGLLNLRGRIVPAFDVRTRLALPPNTSGKPGMSVVVNYNGELYSLIVDEIGEVMSLSSADYEKNPATLNESWGVFSNGVYRLKDKLLIVLDIARLLNLGSK